jgi:hypothetical protein
LTLATTAGLGLRTFARTIHPYPTQAGVFKKIGDAHIRTRFTGGREVALAKMAGLDVDDSVTTSGPLVGRREVAVAKMAGLDEVNVTF